MCGLKAPDCAEFIGKCPIGGGKGCDAHFDCVEQLVSHIRREHFDLKSKESKACGLDDCEDETEYIDVNGYVC